MNRKKLYIIGAAALLILGYLNYYGDETGVKPGEQIVETTDVKYVGDGFKIDAKKQIDYVDKNENKFMEAKAFLKDMILSGDNAFLDAARNLALKSNILGESSNGWSFKADEIDYDKIKDELISKKPVSATNRDLKFSISGDNFKTDSKMSYIELRKNVVLENDKIKVTGEAADYRDSTKQALLKENVKLFGKDLGERFKESLSGDFQQLNYDLNTKVVESNFPYKIYYGSATLSADKFIYNQELDTMRISENVEILANGYTIKVKDIEKKQGSELIYIAGKIVGDNGINFFQGESGVYNPDTNELTITGDVELISKDQGKLLGEKVVYNTATEVLDLYGEERELLYTGVNGELRAKTLNYDQTTGQMVIPEDFTFKNSDYSGKGRALKYNLISKNGTMTQAEILSGERVLVTKLIEFQEENQKIILPEEFQITDIKSGDKLNSKNAVYSKTTGDFQSEMPFTLHSRDSVVTGTGVKYNSITGMGTIEKDILLENAKDNLVVKGDRGEIKKDQYFNLLDNVKINFGDYYTSASRADYSFPNETITIPETVEILSSVKESNFLITEPVIWTKKRELRGKDFTGKEDGYLASSKEVEYDYEKEIIKLKRDGVVSNGEATLKGSNLEYSVMTESMKAIGDYDLLYGNMDAKGKDISLSNSTGDIAGGKIKIWTDKNEEFQADRIQGNLHKGMVDFLGNARGKTLDKGKITQYNGEQLRVHLEKAQDRYRAKRIELLQDSTITQENITMYSKYGDVNLDNNIAISDNGVKILMKDSKKGDTTVTSERAEFHMEKDIIYLNNSVKIVNVDPEKGTTVATGRRGIVFRTENSVELEGDVVIDSPDAIVRAEKAIYNATTKKIKASGDVVVDYKVK